MSRILRRPMFRGGRVDSRGTGITSGLGYEKGGSVEPQATFGVGNNANRDASGREKHAFFIPAAMAAARFLPAAYRGFKAARAYQPFSKNLGIMGRLKDTFLPSAGLRAGMADQGAKQGFALGSMIRSNPLTSLALLPQAVDKGYKAGKYAVTEAIPGIAKTTIDALIPGEKYDLFNEDPDKKTEEEKLLELEQKKKDDEALEQLLKDLAKVEQDKITAGMGSEEDIEINKEKYAKLLGGDKARGKDVTDMLLSFAGKALKPEADVKTAFGEFFEDEAKRPSRGQKIDDAAATLAINEYIAGKKSKAELDRFFAQTDYKASLTSRTGKENIAINIADASQKLGGGYKGIAGGLRISFPKSGTPIKLDTDKGDSVDNVPLKAENFGKIFIEDEAPYRAIMITVEDGQLIRDPLN
jgi:hypothetical protein